MAQRTLSTNVLKAPVRPAPPPPSSITKVNNGLHLASSTARAPPSRPTSDPSKKKIAPPRPPPPKASAQLKAVQNAVIFTSGMQQKKQTQLLLMTSSATAPDLLINWESPPTSPTPGRSSSDGLSLRSFGSDSSGTTAAFMTRSESGFESEPDAWNETAKNTDSLKPFNMPTIIRPNRSGKPPASKSSTHLKELEKIVPLTTSNIQPRSSSPYLADLLDLDLSADYSPPEPTIPPPAPPSFLLEDSPCAVALFDYHSPHSGDLNFKEGDRIVLLSQVNDEWYQGSVGSSAQGMFPASFVRIEVPLTASSEYRAVALYAFQAETGEDLSLQAGDIVQVIESVGNGWLFGQSNGRRGQFPESFVRREC